MNRTICIYHSPCADGFTAAWIVRLALGLKEFETTGRHLSKDELQFYPGVYQTPPPDVTGKILYMVDFSYKRPVMEELARKALKIIHIDHHDTAIVDLATFNPPNFEKFYSEKNTESGAMLTWRYFFPDKEIPPIIRHVDDRDRWQFKLHGTREIQSNIFSYGYTFENWDMLMVQPLDIQISDGTAIERKQHKDIKELSSIVVRRMNIGGYNIPVANVSYMLGSDMGNLLAVNEPFAAYYYDRPDRREFGLRSAEGGIHVGQLALQYGGGGHEHSAGFSVTFDKAREFEI